mgnify:CR=1 FL=1
MGKENIKLDLGNGSLVVDKRLIDDLRGKWLILYLVTREGPCRDNMCQVNYQLEARISEREVSQDHATLIADGVNISIQREIIRAIDKGRQKVVIKKGKLKNIRIVGFNYSI